MARKRMISPEFWRDEKVAELTTTERLLWIGLWTTSDDEGVGRANCRLINSDLFPYDNIPESEISKGMAKIESLGMIQIYSVNGYDYYFIPNFLKHQTISRPTKSNLPKPPQTHQKQAKKQPKTDPESEEKHPENDQITAENNSEQFADFLTVSENTNDYSLSTHGAFTESSLSTHGAFTEDSMQTPSQYNIIKYKDNISKDNILSSENEKESRDEGQKQTVNLQRNGSVATTDEKESTCVSKNQKTTPTKTQETAFETFWELYPKKIGKDAAKRAWQKRKPDKQLQAEIMAGLQRALANDRRFKSGYIPNPATWLNSGEWKNEYGEADAQAPQRGSYQQRKPRANPGEIGEDEMRAIEAAIKSREGKRTG